MISFYLTKDSSTSAILYLDSVANVQTGLPERNYTLINTLGEGSILSGIGNRTGREWTAQYNFKTEDEYDRYNFLNYFQNNIYDTMYLYRQETQRFRCQITAGSTVVNYQGSTGFLADRLSSGLAVSGVGIPDNTVLEPGWGESSSGAFIIISQAATVTISNHELQMLTFTGRTQVYASIDGGESYSNSALSEGIGLHLYSESPFFTSTTLKTGRQFSSTGTSEINDVITNLGSDTPGIWQMTLSTAATSINMFQVKSSFGYGFKVQKQIDVGQTIKVDCRESDLKLYVNDILTPGYFTADSQPFMILSDLGTYQYYVTSGLSTQIFAYYYDRRI